MLWLLALIVVFILSDGKFRCVRCIFPENLQLRRDALRARLDTIHPGSFGLFGPSTTESRLFGPSAQDIILGLSQLFFHSTLFFLELSSTRFFGDGAASFVVSSSFIPFELSHGHFVLSCVCRFKSRQMS
jgi:hypothetical protein